MILVTLHQVERHRDDLRLLKVIMMLLLLRLFLLLLTALRNSLNALLETLIKIGKFVR